MGKKLMLLRSNPGYFSLKTACCLLLAGVTVPGFDLIAESHYDEQVGC